MPNPSEIEQATFSSEIDIQEEIVPEGEFSGAVPQSELVKQTRPAVLGTLATAAELREIRELSPDHQRWLFSVLKDRIEEEQIHYRRPKGVDFVDVKNALVANPALTLSLFKMEMTGGEPDVIGVTEDAFIFADCSEESPARRAGLNFYQSAAMAEEFGVSMMNVNTFLRFQEAGKFNYKSRVWLKALVNNLPPGLSLIGYRGGLAPHDRFTRNDVHVYMAKVQYHNGNLGWRGVLRVPKV